MDEDIGPACQSDISPSGIEVLYFFKEQSWKTENPQRSLFMSATLLLLLTLNCIVFTNSGLCFGVLQAHFKELLEKIKLKALQFGEKKPCL